MVVVVRYHNHSYKMYVLTDISRAHSSGSESSAQTVFETADAVIDYLKNTWYDEFCTAYDYPDSWDADDMSMPFPTKEEFVQSVTDLVRSTKRSTVLFGPYSEYCALVPSELVLNIAPKK